jgi:predicted enzyme related to lactoylglutathione lyase
VGVQLLAVTFDAADPGRLAGFWGALLGWRAKPEPAGAMTLLAPPEVGFDLHLERSDEPKTVKNRMHLDLTSTSVDDRDEVVATVLALGGRHADVGQPADEPQVVLADPEGNELCVVEPGNAFLAGCGFVGALACDGSREAGEFWHAALGWPLVWDQGEETAIQSPRGGPKISWGGAPFDAKTGKSRVHLDLAPPADGDLAREVDRLVDLGASHVDIGQGDVEWVVLADPDGTEFCVLTPR